MSKTAKIVILLIVVVAVGWGIGKYTAPSASPANGTNAGTGTDLGAGPDAAPEASPLPDGEQTPGNDASATAPPASDGSEMVVADPDSTAVMVNKQYSLPEEYKPADLVYPDVPFIFSEKIEKRMLRREAAAALEEMVAAAKQDGVHLAGVSGYRSEATQRRLFNNYVKKDGEEKARTYSAMPGHSEHQTGLAIDLSGSDGKCAAESCFAGTKEAQWLADHATEYGYIIRFPEGKETITGYKYEPWHVRYVGKEIAASIAERGITLEEYFDAIPVSK
ncbi:M15 family metallopeptidase [Paenibacillus piscarius]|uniref:M15 family metallopeptidase n=1 Tax=Paenibacillus piscarius TaxID=1089681 RepID=UPI001EE7E948|nr:M15 family metallopeptidase [Paenibacillus piscarius]